MSKECLALSFLGKRDYEPSRYEWDGKEETTDLLPLAFPTFFGNCTVKLLLTKEAKAHHETRLLKEGFTKEQFIEVPSGGSSAELWEMFQKLADTVSEEADIILDVTHGFRVQPITMLAVGIYLREAAGVNIRHIIYGAHDNQSEEGVTPVVNLLPFIDIIEWARGASYFAQRGDAAFLAEKLKYLHEKSYREQLPYKPQVLNHLAAGLKNLSNAFALIRPASVMDKAIKIGKSIHRLEEDLENLPPSRPAGKLAEKMLQTVDRFIPETFETDEEESKEEVSSQFTPSPKENLEIMPEIVRFYFETRQYQQALTLTVELMINKVCYDSGVDFYNPSEREKAKFQIHRWIKLRRDKSDKLTDYQIAIAEFYRGISDIRNDVNHAGMRPNPQSEQRILHNLETMMSQLPEVLGKSRDFKIQESSSEKLLINLSNHPYSSWSDTQKSRALDKFDRVEDISFPDVPPDCDAEEIKSMGEDLVSKIIEKKPQAVHIMGEQTLCWVIIRNLKSIGIECLASTSQRHVTTTQEGVIREFEFVDFRPYP